MYYLFFLQVTTSTPTDDFWFYSGSQFNFTKTPQLFQPSFLSNFLLFPFLINFSVTHLCVQYLLSFGTS